MHRGLFLVGLVLLLAVPGWSAAAGPWYVSNSGSNGNPCTESQPCQTFEYVRANKLQSGETVYFRAGSYPGIRVTAAQNIPSGANNSSRTLIAGYPGEFPYIDTIDIVYNDVPGNPSKRGLTQYVTFQNFKSRGVGSTGCQQVYNGIDMTCGGHFIRFQDLEVTNNNDGTSCVGGGFGATHTEHINLIVHHCGQTNLDHGFYVCVPDSLYERINVYSNSGYGMQLYEAGPYYPCGSGMIVRNSYIHHNGTTAGGGATIADGDNIQFYNNIVAFNPGGIDFVYSGNKPDLYNLQVYNNTFYGNGGSALTLGNPCCGSETIHVNPKIRNNLFSNNSNDINERNVSSPQYTNNLCPSLTTGCTHTGNPALTNPAGGIFTIEANSEARNKGATLTTFTTDYAFQARNQGGAWDIGAYEYPEGGGGFDFAIQSPGNQSVTQGGAVSMSVTVTLSTGSAVPVTLSTSNRPSGVSESWSSNSCTPTCTVTLTLTATGSAAVGTTPNVTITGTGGGQSRTATFQLTVTASSGAFDFRVPPPGDQTITRGSTTTFPVQAGYTSGTAVPVTFTATGLPTGVSVSGVAGSPCTPPCTAQMTLSATAVATLGTKPDALLVGTDTASTVRDTNFGVTVVATPAPFDFTLSTVSTQAVAQGSTLQVPVTATLVGTTTPVTFSVSGTFPAGVSASVSGSPCSPTCTVTVLITATSSATISTGTTVTLTGTGGGQTHATSFLLNVTSTAPQAVKAFPTAEGFGAVDTKGGRGGAVMQVINRNDSGTGSFRACAEGTGPRTCVFRVGGMIELSSAINIYEANSFLTIAGQTAPGDGVTVGPWPINIAYGAHDVIIRHLRHRQAFESWPVPQTGPPPNENNDCGGFVLYGPNKTAAEGGGTWHVHHVILDHVSTGYTCDDSLQMSGHVTESTIQWALVADPYECRNVGPPSYACGVDPYGASKGFIFGTNAPEVAPLASGAVHHSFFGNAIFRAPGGGPQGVMDWRYNLIYNWNACDGAIRLGGTDENVPGPMQSNHNLVGNRYVAGPSTPTGLGPTGCWVGELHTEGNAHVYVQDNVTPVCGMDACAANEWYIGWGNGTVGVHSYPADPAIFRANTPFAAPAITPTIRSRMESDLAAGAGATIPMRDILDTRVVSEMQNRTGDYGRRGQPFPTLAASSAAPTDTDSDGMPDTWETAHQLNPNDATDRNGFTACNNGYTNLENYLNELAGDAIVCGGPVPSSASPIYVRTTGDDSWNCQEAEDPAKAKRNLGGATGALSCMTVPGKVLYIESGTYTETIDTGTVALTGGNGPSFSDATRLEGYGPTVPILQTPVGSTATTLWLRGSGDHYLVVKKLILDAAGRGENALGIYPGAHHVRLEEVDLKNSAPYEAVYMEGVSQVEFVDTFIHDAGGQALYLNGAIDGFTCQRCHLFSNGSSAVEVTNTGTKTNIVLRETEIYGNTGSGVDLGIATGTLLQNLVMHSNGSAGIRLRSGSSGTKVYNSTVYGNTGVGLQCDAGAMSVELRNNIVYGNTAGNIVNNCGATVAKNFCAVLSANCAVAGDPLFVAAPGDLHLGNGSPAIDAGETIPSILTDYTGQPRQQDAQDVGAYERAQVPPVDANTTDLPCNLLQAGWFF
jgi:Right handed beta helix region